MSDRAKRAALPAFAFSALIGAAIWALSRWVTGMPEPWDTEGVYYVGSLAAGGLVSGLAFPRPLWAHYAGSVLGQLIYALVFLPVGPLIVLGVGFLLAFSALFLAGAYIGATLRRRFGGHEPPDSPAVLQSLVWFLAVALVHFVLSTLGIVFGLRAAFETQGSFWDSPVLAGVAYVSALLLAPLGLLRLVLPAPWRGGFAEIVILSLLVGAVAVGLMHAVRMVRRAARPAPRPPR